MPTKPRRRVAASARKAQRAPGVSQRERVVARAPPVTPVVVGIGASAGGLEAFTRFLQSLPPRPGVALVLVQHLDPTHESILPSLLARITPLPVREAADGTRLQADQVHVIPPDNDITIRDGHLELVARPRGRGQHLPLDLFLTTLAKVQGSRAIAVILSGNGSDGTLGCKAVKAAGGIAFAQEPATARYDGMPRSAIAGGCVDFVLPPEQIAHEIARLAHDPYVRPSPGAAALPDVVGKAPLQRIFALLMKVTRADFSGYKKTTLLRRIHRRMALLRIQRLADYVKRIEDDPAEVQSLHQDLLIHVTSFFRDPRSFEALSREVFPLILAGRSAEMPVRVWVPGCATGEEAYSTAICLLESLSDLPNNPPLQVFATDLSEGAIDKARLGIYPENIASDVSPERLRRFFVRVDGRYQVSRAVRDIVVFARQDLARDPPFSKLDLVSCRNVLIYLEPALQRKILATIHYALGPAGFLVLGKSETVGASSDLFELRDREHKIYTKVAVHRVAGLPMLDGARATAPAGAGPAAPAASTLESPVDVEREAERILLGRYAPASVLVDEAEHVFHFRGDIEPFLGHAQGAASFHLIKMARRGLVPDLRRLLQEARATNTPQRKRGVVLAHRAGSRRIDLEVIPIKGPASGARCFLVLFDGRTRGSREPHPSPAPRGAKGGQDRITVLEQELQALRHYHHMAEQEQAATNEELQTANEEALSSNEELQSINEEMETAKEELQSSNEELTTLNEELQNRNLELQRLNDDLDNFLASTTLPMLMLSQDLAVRRFTPAAARLLSLDAANLGQPLSRLKLGAAVGELEPLVLQVIETMVPQERELQDREGRWWRLLARPYRTRGNKIDGAVLVLVDIDALKRSQEVVEAARDLADAIVSTVREPLLVLSADLRIRRANQAFYQLFRLSPEVAEGASLYELGHGQWDLPRLRKQLEEVLPRKGSFEGLEVEQDFPLLGRRTMVLNARTLRQAEGKEEMILLAIEDVTRAALLEAQRVELLQRTEEAAAAAESASRLKDEFVAVASHELRGPLNAMVGWVQVLAMEEVDAATRTRGLAALDRAVKAQTLLVEELLDLARVMTGKLQLSMGLVELRPVVEAALDAVRPTALAKRIAMGWAPGAGHEVVMGDPARLQQVAWNLLANAVKFTPSGGKVEVSLGRADGQVQLEVRDNGQGIDPAFLPHVFERFRQADSTASRRQGGLGLGLAIVRHMVEMHGGTVTARSPGDGQGATFLISLPVPSLPPAAGDEDETRPAPATEAANAGDPMPLLGVRVLVVEDDADTRELVAAVLGQRGAEVAEAASAVEALAALDREVPDVLVSDIGLPGQNGYDLIRQVRQRPANRGGRVPALALTAYAAAPDRQEATAAGFQDYLAKPADPAGLVAKVAGLASRRPSGTAP